MSLPRAHFRHNWGVFGLSRGDSTWLKPASGACPGRDSNPHEGNPHRILSPVRFFVGPERMKMAFVSTEVFAVKAREAAPLTFAFLRI